MVKESCNLERATFKEVFMLEELERVRNHFWFNFPTYFRRAEYSRSAGSWIFPLHGKRYRIIPGSPLQAVDAERGGERLDLLEILSKAWRIPRREVWERLLVDSRAGMVTMIPGRIARRWFSGSWRG